MTSLAIAPAPVSFDTSPPSTYQAIRALLPQWEPSKAQSYLADGTPAGMAVVRPDTGSPIGYVGDGYRLIRHDDLAQGLAPIVGQIGADITSAKFRSYADGAKGALTFRVPGRDLVVEGDPAHRGVQIVARWSHDTDWVVSLDVQVMRMVCANGLMAFTGILPSLRTRHTTHGPIRFRQEASRFAAMLDQGVANVSRLLSLWSESVLDVAQVNDVIGSVLGVKGEPTAQQQSKAATIRGYLHDQSGRMSPYSRTRSGSVTALSLFEAFTAYDRHASPTRFRATSSGSADDKRDLALFAGSGLGIRARAFLPSVDV